MQRNDRLLQIDRLGRDVLAAAQTGDWEAVGSIHERLRQAARALLERPPAPEDVPAISAMLKSALELNDQAMGLCAQERGRKMQEFAQAGNSRMAMKQYSDNSG
jgi:Flagellar protein FliT